MIASRPVDAYAVFARAREVWEAQRYPRAVSYTVAVRVDDRGRQRHRHYASTWIAGTNRVIVNPVSAEESARPYVPPAGVPFGILGIALVNIGGPRRGTGTHGNLIGVPQLAPNYSFGIAPYVAPEAATPAELVAQVRASFRDPAPAKVQRLEQQAGFKTIAVVNSAPVYRIVLAGIENVGGHADYHLALTPLREPQRYRLRDVWVDEATYATDRLRVAGNFLGGGTASVPWTVDFSQHGGAQYIAQETSDEPINDWFDRITVSFEDVARAENIPPFDPLGNRPSIREPDS